MRNYLIISIYRDEKILVSTKSLDIASQSYQNPTKLRYMLDRYADDLINIENRYFNYYNLNLYYCIMDYYDFYYDNPSGGKDSVGSVNNDEMAFGVPFDEARPFEDCGVYHVNIKWKKGQKLSEAIQTSLGYSYLGH